MLSLNGLPVSNPRISIQSPRQAPRVLQFSATPPAHQEPLQQIQIGSMRKSPENLLMFALTFPLALPLIALANLGIESQLIKVAQKKVLKMSEDNYWPWPKNFNILAATLQDCPGLSTRWGTFNYSKALMKKLKTSSTLFDAHYELEQKGVRPFGKLLGALFGWFQVPVSSTQPIATWRKDELRNRHVIFITGSDHAVGKKVQANTVTLVQKTLQKEYGVPESQFKRLDTPTLDEVETYIYELSERLNPQDEVLIYLLGHGEILPSEETSPLQGGKEGALILNDKEVLSKKTMKAYLENYLDVACHSGSLIVDICHSGAWIA